ncbi:uncharacterized protein LOC143300599 [Babylonia areolata]|uniref:uncharacterized protein LOC143300599 n=1 Tax=Babylonia areolata TaxID=304850 RepID=UPI003FD5A623
MTNRQSTRTKIKDNGFVSAIDLSHSETAEDEMTHFPVHKGHHWGSKLVEGDGGEEKGGDLTLISFLVSHGTASAWHRLKQFKSLDDSQLAVFLLQCHEDTLHSPVCPHCQSVLQQFCPACSTAVGGRPKGHNQLPTTTTSERRDTPENESDQSTAGCTDATAAADCKHELHHTHVSVEKGNASDTHSGQSKRRKFSSVDGDTNHCACSVEHTDMDCDNNHWACSVEHTDGLHSMDEQPAQRKEGKNDDSSDDTVDYVEERDSARTVDMEDTDDDDESASGVGRGGMEVSENNLEKAKWGKNQLTFENKNNEKEELLDEASGWNVRLNVDNEHTLAGDVKVEIQDSKENKQLMTIPPDFGKPDTVSCSWCEESFSTIVALTRHLTVHTTRAWQCQNLPHTPHKPTQRQQRRPVSSIMNGTCWLKMKVRANRMTRSQRRNSKSDSNVFEESMDLSSLSPSGQRIFHCLQCGEGWKTPVGLTYHIQSAHIKRNTYRCLKCGKTFNSLRGIAFHMRIHPAKKSRERDPTTHPHQCGPCGARFMHVGNLANHMERHTGPSQFWCSKCQHRFHSLTELTGHHCELDDRQSQGSLHAHNGHTDAATAVQSSGKEPEEEQKPEVKDTDTLFSEPLNDKSGRQKEEEKETTVSWSEAEDQDADKKRKPAKRGRKRKTAPALLTMKEVQRPYKCSECPASFLYASVLKVHSQKHSGQSAFPCGQCDQSFLSKTRLYHHQERDHWGSVPITCHDCGKVFASARTLDEHQVFHTGELPYPCPTCGQAFPYRTALTRHRRLHRGSYFRCKECGAEFHLQSQYRRHVAEHSTVRPHLCSHCGRGFGSLASLKQHTEKHGQEKQFVCELCGKAFRTKGEHKMHLMTHQAVKPFPCPLCERTFISRGKLRLHHSRAHLGLKPHRCQQCQAAFSSATYLQDHVRFAHTTERPFPCPICSARFAANRFLKLHLKRTHKKSAGDLTPTTTTATDSK